MTFLYKLIKHRGEHDEKIKENTYVAILKAFNNDKYIGVEFDVRETKDHKFIIFHNATYKGKLISEYLFKDLPKFIPSLEMILKIKSNKIFLIEVKNIHNYSQFIKILTKYKRKNLYVMSFSNKIIRKLNIPTKTYKVGVLNYVLNTSEDITALDFVCILNSLINSQIIDFLKPLEVFSYGLFENLKYDNIYYIVDK